MFDTYQNKEKIIHDELMQTTQLNSNNRSPLKRFNFTAEIPQKLSSRSLANRNQTCKAGKKLFSFTQKHIHDSLLLSDKSFDTSLNTGKAGEPDFNLQSHKQETLEFGTEGATPDSQSEFGKLHQRLNQAEIGYLKWKKWAEKQNKSIVSYEKKVGELVKELKKAHKKINKYKQIKEHSDNEIAKLKENQQDMIMEHTSKMKQVFLKEYEELINNKSNDFSSPSASSQSKLENEISELTGKLTNSSLEIRNLKSQISGNFFSNFSRTSRTT